MKKFILYFLAILGVIFLGLLVAVAYFFITDPYNLRPLLFGTDAVSVVNTSNRSESEESSGVPAPIELTAEQREAVTAIGLDPEAIPETISTEKEVCFEEVLGRERVDAIKAGAVPSALEIARASSCL